MERCHWITVQVDFAVALQQEVEQQVNIADLLGCTQSAVLRVFARSQGIKVNFCLV